MTKKKIDPLPLPETAGETAPPEAGGSRGGANSEESEPRHGGRKRTENTAGAPDPYLAALREIADWILRGENETSISEAAAALFPDYDKDELLTAATEYLGELAGTDPEVRRTWHIAARRELYRRAVEIHDYKTARDILRDLGQIEGLYPKQAPTRSVTPQKKDESLQPDGIPTAGGFPVVQ